MKKIKEVITWNLIVLKNVLKEKYREVVDKNGKVNEQKLNEMAKNNNDIIMAKVTHFDEDEK